MIFHDLFEDFSIYVKPSNMYIYKITNKINNKIYIGKRTSKRKNYWGSGKLIKQAIRKYGVENFINEIIEYCADEKILCEREIFWIEYFNSRNRDIGYNITKGGDGNNTSKYWLKREFTLEHRKNISKHHADVSGEKNPMFGRTHKDSVKENLRKLKTGIMYSEACKAKQSEKRKGSKNPNSKLNDEIVLKIRNEYNEGVNSDDLAKKYGVNKPCIWKIIHNYTWRHLINI
jgi:group I intron endonuclease